MHDASARAAEQRSGYATLVFTTSPLLLDQCDRVLFAPEGTVVAAGNHHDLVRGDSAYRAVVIRGED